MRYLIDGCYGDGNVGDECLLKAVCGLVRRYDTNAEIAAFSSDPRETEAVHGLKSTLQVNPFGKGIYGAIGKGLLLDTIREIRNCDVFVLGGGELFRDCVGLSATLGMFYRMRLARQMGKRIVAMGVGAQQPTRWWGKYVLRQALAAADYVVFRDPIALETATNIAPTLATACWAPDLVFSLEWEQIRQRQAVSQAEDDILRIGIAIKSLPHKHRFFEEVDNHLPAALVETIRSVSVRRKTRVTAMAFAEADRRLTGQIVDQLRLVGIEVDEVIEPDFERLQIAISQMDCMLAQPFHASVFAFATGVPAIGLAYDPKVTRLYRAFGLDEFCLPLSHLDATTTAERLQRLLRQRSQLSDRLVDTSDLARDEICARVGWIMCEEQLEAASHVVRAAARLATSTNHV